MKGFIAALRSELYVAVRSRWPLVLVLAPAAVAAASIFLLEVRAGSLGARAALLGRAAPRSAGEGGYGVLVDGLSYGLSFGYLALAAAAALSIAADRERGTIRHLLVCRAGRTSCVLAKYAFLMGLGILVFILVGLSAAAMAALFHDLGPVVEDGLEIIGVAEIHREIARGVGLALAPLPAAVAFALLISAGARSASGALAGVLGLTVAFDLLKGGLGGLSRYIYASYSPSLIDRSYLKEVSRLVRGFSDVFVADETIRLNVLTPWPAALVFLALALWIVHRREM